MDIQKRSVGFGAALLIFAALFRLVVGGLSVSAQSSPLSAELPLRLPVVAFTPLSPTLETTSPTASPTAPTWNPPSAPTEPPKNTVLPTSKIAFSAADETYLRLRSATDCPYTPVLLPLLLQPLTWQLDTGDPTVLIYHSHACESYAPQDNSHTTDPNHNMLAVGDALATLLEARGITVLHDRQLHDALSYNNAYTNSGRSVSDYLRQYPSLRLILDLHRDAATAIDGSAYATSVTIDGETAAQFMFVIGTDANGMQHRNWQKNLGLACKLQVLLEKQVPGITRRSTLRGCPFNQNLSEGALLIEVGASGNTLQQVYRSLPYLANAIAQLSHGSGEM